MSSQPLKSRLPLLVIFIILLPVVLAACGEGGPTGNAKDFANALTSSDEDKAKDASCDAFHNEVDFLFSGGGIGDGGRLKDLECEEDGDIVRCTGKDADDIEGEFVFTMEDEKVCGIVSITVDGRDLGASIPVDFADDLPSLE